MQLALAVLSVVFFHGILFDGRFGTDPVGVVLFEIPVLGAIVGGLLAMMAASCIGKQTAVKTNLSVAGVIGLLCLLGWIWLMSGDPGLTFLTSIPFMGTSITLLTLRIREKRAAAAAAGQEEKQRLDEIRAGIPRRPSSG